MRMSFNTLLAVAGTWLFLGGCAETESVAFDLLPPGSTARVESALRVPPAAKLRLELDVTPTVEGDKAEATASSQLEIWVHTRGRPRGHLLDRLALREGENSAVVQLDRLARRDVLLQLIPKGMPPEGVSWRQAVLEGTIEGTAEAGRSGDYGALQADAAAPDIVLYVIDTLRADALGVYGGSHETPQIDRFSDEGVRFDHAEAPATWTRPATASLLTGLYPSTHDAEDRPDRVPESAFTLAERLRLLGYSTAAVITNGNLDPVWGFDQGFEFFVRPKVPDRDAQGRPRRHLHAEEAHEVALREWRERKEDRSRPVLLYVHTVDPHGPYDPPEWLLSSERPELGNTNPILDDLNQGKREPTHELMTALRTLYAGEVAYADREFGEFLSELGSLDDTIMVFTSDHGEAFQEHGFSSHGMSLYQEEMQVPLMLRAPGRVPAGTVVEAPVSLIDILPTLFALIGETAPADEILQGEALDGAWGSEAGSGNLSERPLMAEIDYDGRRWQSLRLEADKLMTHLNSERRWLFDLETDPGETRNLFPVVAEERRSHLSGILSRILEAAGALRLEDPKGSVKTPVSEDAIEHLRALGYVQ